MAEDLVALENFLLENEELEKLESLLAEFNVFETLDAVRAEIRHSNVLAWLMSPNANHGLGDRFLRSFLKHLFADNRDAIKSELTFFHIEGFNLDDVEIRREWNRIDLLLVSEANNLVVVIENKVGTDEHDDQLNRYFRLVSEEFPECHKIFVFLTPEGLTPSDEANWIIFDYPRIYYILRRLLESRKNTLSEGACDFINQYCIILRRYSMPGSEIEEICRRIYQKHRQALDLIFEYKSDSQLEVSEIVQDLVKKNDNLVVDGATKTVIRFTSRRLDDVIPKKGQGWVSSNRILLFEFDNDGERGMLRLYIGPGDNEIRNRLHAIAKKDTKLFNMSDRKLGSKWLAIYQKEYLKAKDYEESDAVDLRASVSKKFNAFISEDLPKIERHIIDNWK
jgi:hypothetical protein